MPCFRLIARNWGDVEPRFHEQRTVYNRQSNSHLCYYPNTRLLLAQIDSLRMMFRTIRIITTPSIQKRTLTPFIYYSYICIYIRVFVTSLLRAPSSGVPSSGLHPPISIFTLSNPIPQVFSFIITPAPAFLARQIK